MGCGIARRDIKEKKSGDIWVLFFNGLLMVLKGSL